MPTYGEAKHNAIVEAALATIAKELTRANKLKELELLITLKKERLPDNAELLALLDRVSSAD